MTGHIRRRGANSWELKFSLGTDALTGKRKNAHISFKGTKRDAQLHLAQRVAAHSRGLHVDASRETVAEFTKRWLQDWATGNVSNRTYARYEELLRRHVVARIGPIQIQKLTATALQSLYATLQRDGRGDRGLQARTVLHVHRVVHRMLGHAAQWGVVHSNVAANVDAPSVQAKEIETLTPGQVKAVFAKLRGTSLHIIASTLLATGMRRGELLALRWQDVDLDGAPALLRVEQSLEYTKRAGLVFKAPKTKYGRRPITLPLSTVAELRAHWKAQQERRLALGMGKAPEDSLVFATWDGKPRSPNGLTKEWTRALAGTDRPVTLHSLRHTHASTLIASGLDVLTISRRLGHGSPAITLTVYGHLFKPDDRAAAIMEAAFAGTD